MNMLRLILVAAGLPLIVSCGGAGGPDTPNPWAGIKKGVLDCLTHPGEHHYYTVRFTIKNDKTFVDGTITHPNSGETRLGVITGKIHPANQLVFFWVSDMPGSGATSITSFQSNSDDPPTQLDGNPAGRIEVRLIASEIGRGPLGYTTAYYKFTWEPG